MTISKHTHARCEETIARLEAENASLPTTPGRDGASPGLKQSKQRQAAIKGRPEETTKRSTDPQPAAKVGPQRRRTDRPSRTHPAPTQRPGRDPGSRTVHVQRLRFAAVGRRGTPGRPAGLRPPHTAAAASHRAPCLCRTLPTLWDNDPRHVSARGDGARSVRPAPLPSARPGQRGRKKRRIGHNLALRLRDRKLSVLRFQRDPTVPSTNNEAERDLRMMKLRQKVSGGFRSERGASDFAVLRSVLTTARKQGWDLLATLMTPCDDLAAALRYA